MTTNVLIAAGKAARGEETYPAEIAARLVAGETPLKVIRNWRGLSQAELGKKSGVNHIYLSQIERTNRKMGRKVAAKLAAVLGVTAEILMDI
jgi:DNA-binding XRE family transcriptional regulator